jgi:ABC-2 type transport system permease protein
VTVLVRDVDRIVHIVVRVLYYASPVLYSVNEPRLAKIRPVYDANPIAGVLDMMRVVMFPKEMDVTRMCTSAATSVVIFLIGVFVFARLERQILKEI